jgi:hypothetical protein
MAMKTSISLCLEILKGVHVDFKMPLPPIKIECRVI